MTTRLRKRLNDKERDCSAERMLANNGEALELLEVAALAELPGITPPDFTEDELDEFAADGFTDFARKSHEEFTESDVLAALLFQFYDEGKGFTAEQARQMLKAVYDTKDRRAELTIKLESATGPMVQWQFPLRRGGRHNVKWTNEKALKLLETYQRAEERVTATMDRYKKICDDSQWAAMLQAADQSLPAWIIQQMPRLRGTSPKADLALQLAAEESNIEPIPYLRKVLTKARKLKRQTNS